MRVVTLPVLLALTKEGTREGAPSQMGERLSRPSFAASSAVLVRDEITVPLRGPRVAGRRPRTLFSNRELDLLERGLSRCKQRKATVSNRELWTVENPAKIVNSSSFRMSEALSLPVISDTNFRQLASFLTGTASLKTNHRRISNRGQNRMLPISRAAAQTTRMLLAGRARTG